MTTTTVGGVTVEVRTRHDEHEVRRARMARVEAELSGHEVLVEAVRDERGRLRFTVTTLEPPRPGQHERPTRALWEVDPDAWRDA